MIELRGAAPAPPAPQMFGNAGRDHMEKYGTTALQFAKIGYKNHKHSVNNPYSQFQTEYSLQDILDAPMIYEPLTKLQCCPTSDGSGAADRRERGHSSASTSWNRRRSRSSGRRWPLTCPAPSTARAASRWSGYDLSRNGSAQGLRAVGARPGERGRD